MGLLIGCQLRTTPGISFKVVIKKLKFNEIKNKNKNLNILTLQKKKKKKITHKYIKF